MRHFDFLEPAERSRLFHLEPAEFDRHGDASVLAAALGATLYSPATRPALADDIAGRAAAGVLSCVVCLEDAIADEDVADAERNVVVQLSQYATRGLDAPLIFVRVREAAQIPLIAARLGDQVGVLSGFVLPKFTRASAGSLDAVADAAATYGVRLFAMPVLESPSVIHRENRTEELAAIRDLLDRYRDIVLAVRIGATDLSSAYGLRRSRDLTIYDVQVVAQAIADAVNILGRADGSGFVLTGPAWEYFSGTERLFKPQLRETPFVDPEERALRAELITGDLDGLIREVALDKANGLTGKTVIHPSHVAAVHALSVVTHEEYSDAVDILNAQRVGGGARASGYRNKMNESKPHRAWADRIMTRAHVFGVARKDISFVDLLGASVGR